MPAVAVAAVHLAKVPRTFVRRSRHRDAVAIFFKFPLISSRNSCRHRRRMSPSDRARQLAHESRSHRRWGEEVLAASPDSGDNTLTGEGLPQGRDLEVEDKPLCNRMAR
jgi:hypothetical protein